MNLCNTLLGRLSAFNLTRLYIYIYLARCFPKVLFASLHMRVSRRALLARVSGRSTCCKSALALIAACHVLEPLFVRSTCALRTNLHSLATTLVSMAVRRQVESMLAKAKDGEKLVSTVHGILATLQSAHLVHMIRTQPQHLTVHPARSQCGGRARLAGLHRDRVGFCRSE